MHAPLAAAGTRMPQGCVQPHDRLHTGCQPSACHIYACTARNAGNAARMMQSAGRGRLEAPNGAARWMAAANQRRPECRMGSRTRQWHSTSAILDALVLCRECRAAVEVPISRAHHACMTRHVRTTHSGMYAPLTAAGTRKPQGCIQPQDRLHSGCKPSACHIYARTARNAGNAARMLQTAGRARLEARTTRAARFAG